MSWTKAEEYNHIIMIKFKEGVDDAVKKETPLIKEAINQLSLKSNGTDFQQRVWTAPQRIPYGQV